MNAVARARSGRTPSQEGAHQLAVNPTMATATLARMAVVTAVCHTRWLPARFPPASLRATKAITL